MLLQGASFPSGRQTRLVVLMPRGTEDTDETPTLTRIRSHDEYSHWIYAMVINSHICMEIRFATSYFCFHTYFHVNSEKPSKYSSTISLTHTSVHIIAANLLGMQTESKTTIRSFLVNGRSPVPQTLCALQHHQQADCHVFRMATAFLQLPTIMIVYLNTLAFVSTGPQCLLPLYFSSFHCSSPPSVTNSNRFPSPTPVCLLASGETKC